LKFSIILLFTAVFLQINGLDMLNYHLSFVECQYVIQRCLLIKLLLDVHLNIRKTRKSLLKFNREIKFKCLEWICYKLSISILIHNGIGILWILKNSYIRIRIISIEKVWKNWALKFDKHFIIWDFYKNPRKILIILIHLILILFYNLRIAMHVYG